MTGSAAPAACLPSLSLTVPAGAGGAIAWLGSALAGHPKGQYCTSVLDAQNPRWGYGPNIDIVIASVFQNLTWSYAAFFRPCGPAPPRPDTTPALGKRSINLQ